VNPQAEAHPVQLRLLALVVRYWACNITMVHDQGQSWPGFGYTEPEKDTLTGIARKVDSVEFFVWMALVVVCFLAFAALITAGGFLWVQHAQPQSAQVSATIFFIQMGSLILVCMAVAFPLAMLIASWASGLLFSPPDTELTDHATTVHFIVKLLWQLTRMALLGSVAVVALLLFVPGHSNIEQLLKVVMPILAPAVSVLTLVYYGSTRLRRSAPEGT